MDPTLKAMLAELLAKHGSLSAEIIDGAEGMPSSAGYQGRFGSLLKAYQRVGYSPARDYRYIEINRHLRSLQSPFEDDVVAKLQQMGASITRQPDTGRLLINGEYTAEVLFTRCMETPAGSSRWQINLGQAAADITVVARMDDCNQSVADFYLLPRIDMRQPMLRLGDQNGAAIDTYRYENLNFFIAMSARTSIEVAA